MNFLKLPLRFRLAPADFSIWVLELATVARATRCRCFLCSVADGLSRASSNKESRGIENRAGGQGRGTGAAGWLVTNQVGVGEGRASRSRPVCHICRGTSSGEIISSKSVYWPTIVCRTLWWLSIFRFVVVALQFSPVARPDSRAGWVGPLARISSSRLISRNVG